MLPALAAQDELEDDQLDSQQQRINILRNLVITHLQLNQFEEVVFVAEDALRLSQEIEDRETQVVILNRLASALNKLGRYEQAIARLDQGLALAQENERANLLFSKCAVVDELGEHDVAIELAQEALTLAATYNSPTDQMQALLCMGSASISLGQHEQAVEMLQQVLTIAEEHNSIQAQRIALLNLGWAHQSAGQYEQAIVFFERALPFAQQLQDPLDEAWVIGNLGYTYGYVGRYEEGLDLLSRALTVAEEVNDQRGQWAALRGIGEILERQNRPELAIVYFKQSVNVIEEIRGEFRTLSPTTQQAYAESVSDIYRRLANLLLQQNRVLEAQRVLDLLKVQELEEYLQDVRRNGDTENGVELLNAETEIQRLQQSITNQAIAVGYELAQLRDIPPSQLSDAQIQRLGELDTTQREMSADFQGFLNSPEIQSLVAQLDATQQEQDILARADEFINLQNNLRAIDQNAVLIYPLILEDRLELVLVTPFSEPARYPVPVGSAELNAAIVEFRQALDDPRSNPQAIAQQLYNWLIAPMENDLEAIGAETILYAPDGALRYVPLAALHDGNQWLIETYRINHITAASLQDFTLAPDADPLILAAAFSEGDFDFEVGQRSFSFSGLPFAGKEVENLAAAFPDTTQLMNDRFSRSLTEPLMDSHTIVHLATHAAFVPGSPAESFILFGNGDRLSLAELNSDDWRGRFNRVELIVLSACETGLGGDTLGDGAEILGFGYLMQETGAEAAIASLWSVSDGGTQVLMDAFYTALNNGYSKAEALQRSQQALITSDETVLAGDRGVTVEITDTRTGQPLSQSNDLAHPYYWAPFILIGNGL
ncbi:MAG: CHAT domain-containing protein [Elainellaceae cyanobacterium]